MTVRTLAEAAAEVLARSKSSSPAEPMKNLQGANFVDLGGSTLSDPNGNSDIGAKAAALVSKLLLQVNQRQLVRKERRNFLRSHKMLLRHQLIQKSFNHLTNIQRRLLKKNMLMKKMFLLKTIQMTQKTFLMKMIQKSRKNSQKKSQLKSVRLSMLL